MGEGALTRHAKGDIHKNNLDQFMKTKRFFHPRKSADPDVSTSNQPAEVVIPDEPVPSASNNEPPIIVNEPIPSLMRGQSAKKAQIIWAFQCVVQGYSDNSNIHFGDILRAMCPNSLEAQDFSMGPSKLKYVINHGLHPYYKDLLDKEVQQSPFLTIMFDESMNDVLQKSEMDVHVGY